LRFELRPCHRKFRKFGSVAPSAERGQGNSVVMTWQAHILPVRNVVMA